jgi:hypothetical protein
LDLELNKDFYWGVVPGQPELTAADLARVGKEDTVRTKPATPGGRLDPANAD